MLTIVVPGVELYDQKANTFSTEGDYTLTLEHSLVSLSKWEAKYEKPYLSREEKTTNEVFGYIKCMTVTRNVPEEVYSRLSERNISDINDYIDAKMTATWFGSASAEPKTREIITSELIYYWMITFNIPFECERWHLHRLFTLIQVCNTKQAKPQKMSRSDAAARRRDLNDQRRKKFGTSG